MNLLTPKLSALSRGIALLVTLGSLSMGTLQAQTLNTSIARNPVAQPARVENALFHASQGSAHSDAVPTKWEYMVKVITPDSDFQQSLTIDGGSGWELVSVLPAGAMSPSKAVYKRILKAVVLADTKMTVDVHGKDFARASFTTRP